jgi:hypothetical protein
MGRVVFLTGLISGAAVLLFVLAALMTDGELSRTPGEWLCSITGAVIVWPVVAVSRLLHVESAFIVWPLWLASGFFWALLVEWLLVRKRT